MGKRQVKNESALKEIRLPEEGELFGRVLKMILLQAEFQEGLSVIGNGGRLGAVGTFTERNRVQVQLQDFVLGQLLFDLQRQQHLLELADEGLFETEGDVACQLHGDGACAGGNFPFPQQCQGVVQ